jgi:hypothetical protein
MFAPFIVTVMVFLFSYVKRMRSGKKLSTHFFQSFLFERLISVVVLFVIALYTFLVSSALSPFKCSSFNGRYTMFESPSDSCFDADWFKHLPAVIFFALAYTLGLPGILLFLFWKNRANLDNEHFLAVFQSLVSPYRTRFVWWEIVSVSKRTLFVVLCSFLSMSESTSGLVFSAFCVLIVFMFLEIICKPFKRHHHYVISIA